MVKKLYFCGVTPVKGKHEGNPEIGLIYMKTVKIFTIFPERDSIFPGELRLSPPSGQLHLERFYPGERLKNKTTAWHTGEIVLSGPGE